MNAKEWNYTQLPTGWYSAHVYLSSWGTWNFNAYPSRGDHTMEGRFKTEEEAVQAAEDWIARRETELTKRLYSSCY